MTSRRRSRWAIAAALAVLALGLSGGCLVPGCAREHPSVSGGTEVHLTGEWVATVGSATVSGRMVEAIMAAQGGDPNQALDAALHDTLLALETRERLGPAGVVHAAERAVLVRALLEDIWDRSRVRVPTAEESSLTAKTLWFELDRPPAVETRHAVVRVKQAERFPEAKRVADRLAVAVRGVTDPEEFKRRAMKVRPAGFELRVEDVPALTREGWLAKAGAPPQRHFSLPYAEAAHTLQEVGQQSALVRTEFGYHVLLLTRRHAEHRAPERVRRQRIREELQLKWAREERDAMLARLANPPLGPRPASSATPNPQGTPWAIHPAAYENIRALYQEWGPTE